jgi:hypothetical protein
LSDASSLRRAIVRTRSVRVALAAALLGLTSAAVFAARSAGAHPSPLLQPGASGIIVLDVSGSVEATTLDRVYSSLSELARTDDRFGMVVFANRAYEALPPDTPARELGPFARFFHPAPSSGASGPLPPQTQVSQLYPANPWKIGFDAGTEISTGLKLARSIILAEPSTSRSVWLISDLADDPHDLPSVTRVAKSYVTSDIALNLIELDPSSANRRFFTHLLGPRGTIVPTKPSSLAHLSGKRSVSITLAILAAGIAVLLMVAELLASPLRWRAVPAELGTVNE